MSLQEKGKMVSAQLLKSVLKNTPTSGPIGAIAQKVGAKISKEVLGYDFVGLITKLVVFYAIAYLVRSYFGAVIFGNTTLNALGSVLGLKFNSPLPQSVINFMKNGFLISIGKPDPNLGQMKLSLSYYDFINVAIFGIVLAEAIRNYEDNKKMGGRFSYITIALWGLIIASIGLLTFSNIISRFQTAQKILVLESQAIQQQQSGDTRTALATLQAASALLTGTAGLVQIPITTGPQVAQ